MRLYRIYESEFPSSGQHRLSDENARIVMQVLRVREDEALFLMNGRGEIAEARVSALGRREVSVDVLNVETHKQALPRLTLLMGMPKGDKTSAVVQDAVEWGAASVVFVETEHAIPQKKDSMSSRLERVAIEAMRQSGNPFLMDVRGPVSILEALDSTPSDLSILCDERERSQTLRSVAIDAKPQSIRLAVGPEGGWSHGDRDLFQSAGFTSVSLGPYTLRCETAAAGALAAARALFSL